LIGSAEKNFIVSEGFPAPRAMNRPAFRSAERSSNLA